ncbi:transposase [Streptomyces sp. CA-251387]|uniref:transposase n=1 Tax=Streptomyces sp. CA-251387 TaxID=3240064 RepID=UPI003D921D27
MTLQPISFFSPDADLTKRRCPRVRAGDLGNAPLRSIGGGLLAQEVGPGVGEVEGRFEALCKGGLDPVVHDLLRDKTRRAHGRSTEPTAAVVDAQSVKTSANVAETSQGIDAGKKIKGRKRHLITDTLGLVLAVLITAANVHDTVGGKLLLDDLAAAHPGVTKVWADGGYQNSIFKHGAGLGIDVEVVHRPQTKGFEPLPKRWVIERTFGWQMQHRRLARDYDALPQRSRTMIH